MTTREEEQQEEGLSVTLGALATLREMGAYVRPFPAKPG